MSGRRGGNRIRGPQSALTDFLAANNISAAQIRDDYERRRQQRLSGEDTEAGPSTAQPQTEDDGVIAEALQAEQEEEEAIEAAAQSTRKRKRTEKDAIDKIKKAKASKKDGKEEKGKAKKKKSRKRGSDDESGDDDYDEDFAKDMYKKSQPLPGQLENCELCNKRFTVTPYSKAGPDGGLLCTPCGKQMTKEIKKEERAAAPKALGRKRRKVESDRLDGIANGGAKTLQQICIERVAAHHEDIEELGDMPQSMVERLSEIFSKKRVLKPKTLPLFLRPDLDSVVVHDAAYLEPPDYQQIFAVVPNMQRLVLGNACQMKDEAIDYMLERCRNMRHFQVYAANLVSNDGWHRFFEGTVSTLETLKLKWLDAAFDDEVMETMVQCATGLNRLKLKLCRRVTQEGIRRLARLRGLEHLSLQVSHEVETDVLLNLIQHLGGHLRTLSLEKFLDADDRVLEALHECCTHLKKLRFSENDTATDDGFVSLFTEWSNPPLLFIDVNSTRDVDNNNPDGPEDRPIGVASDGFRALMAHSGTSIRHLDISSCRHIGLSSFLDVFNPTNLYPDLEYINISFCPRVNTSVVAGIFKSCPNLKRLVAFGCFDVQDVVVPRNIALIGIPKAQDAIEQFGVGIGVDEALGRMVEVGA